MSEDFRVNRRSDGIVREAAERAKRLFRVDKVRPVNIIRCLVRDGRHNGGRLID